MADEDLVRPSYVHRVTEPIERRDAGSDALPVAGVPQQPGLPAGFPTAVPPGYAANMVSALEAAGVAIPGPTRAVQSRSRTWIWGLGILAVGLGGLLVRGYVEQRQHVGALTIWQVIWLTLPIVAAAAFVAYRFAAGRGLGFSHLLGLVVGTAGTSYLTGISSGQLVSSSLFKFDPSCLLQNTCATTLATANPASYVLKVVNNYWHVYGTAGFVSAAVVGAVIGLGLGLIGRRRPGLSR
jgi:hypothetical protein